MAVNEISDFEKHIYNTFIKVSRGSSGKPYKTRKNFDDLLEKKEYAYLKKLSNFFNRFKHIDVKEFFSAPYELYKDEKYFELDYYTTLKAVKAYSTIVKKNELLDPDEKQQLQSILKSFKFIKKFCHEQNINVDSYVNHKTNNIFSFVLHLQEHQVNFYSLLEFKDTIRNIRLIGPEIIEFMFGNDFYNKIETFRTKYIVSKKARMLGSYALKKIKNNT